MIEKKNSRAFIDIWWAPDFFSCEPFSTSQIAVELGEFILAELKMDGGGMAQSKIKMREKRKCQGKAKNGSDQKFNQINDDWVGSEAEVEDGLNESNDEVDGCNQDNKVYRQQIELRPGRDRPKRSEYQR